MKVCVYTIALNEAKHVERFMSTASEADYVVIADTGSTDGTVEALREAGALVHSISIKPWRFDDARNAALALVPDDVDVCVVVDMDEVLDAGWRAALESVWIPRIHTRGRYLYTWSHEPDGSPGVTFMADRVHARHGYRWLHPCHETLTADRVEDVHVWLPYELHHWPDDSKSRGQYLPLLEVAARERPNDARSAHYLGREYLFRSMWVEADAELRRHLSLPESTWKPERAASMRHLSTAATALGRPDDARHWAHMAAEEAPELREGWVAYARVCYEQSHWEECLRASLRALAIEERPPSYLSEPWAWGSLAADLGSIAAWNLHDPALAADLGHRALALSPDDKRIARNVAVYEAALGH